MPKIADTSKYNAVIQILFNLSTYFLFFGASFLDTMISSIKVVTEPRAEWTRQKFAQKLLKTANIPIYNAIIHILLKKLLYNWLIWTFTTALVCPSFERNLQDIFSENFLKFCHVRFWAKIEKGDYFAKVIMSLFSNSSQ